VTLLALNAAPVPSLKCEFGEFGEDIAELDPSTGRVRCSPPQARTLRRPYRHQRVI